MTPRVFACYANESLAECMRQMGRHQVRRVPVVDDRGRLVGIVSQGDLARFAAHRRIPEQKRAVADVVSAVSEPTNTPYR
jgi:CBS domain-containing protein